MATYSNSSPYFDTPQLDSELKILSLRNIPHEDDDVSYTIKAQYQYRPDLLAYDLYDDVGLWWVFINRNPDVIQDPIFDFKEGTIIRLSKKSSVNKALGI